ncbi:MAG: 2-oxo-acid dehydrogenase subunit, homodimeric type, partial [Arthrobacter sp.]|nr:2-oxo-acid dehydrogenase subunit, homodimeric type [Arthrobacter sp.]MCU1539662.1 2-oxo-acid dehydrogenase subunit, homodimeric type [Arthrobacter sp.]
MSATHPRAVPTRVADDDYACKGERPADTGRDSCDWTLPGAHDRAVVTDMSHTSRSRQAVTLPELRVPMNALKERLDVAAGEDTSHILSGLTNQLPDRDPEETAEWLESLD